MIKITKTEGIYEKPKRIWFPLYDRETMDTKLVPMKPKVRLTGDSVALRGRLVGTKYTYSNGSTNVVYY